MKRSGKFFLLAWVLIWLMPCANSFGMVFPGTDWVEMSPESQGVDSTKLNQALNYLESKTGSDGIREVVIIRNGYMIWQGDNIDNKHGVWSCTKAFTSTVMGLLVDDEKCDPAILAKDFVPSLSSHYSNLNLAHFATMTSGYDAEGGSIWDNNWEGSYTPWIPTDPLFTPGEAFLYWDDAVNMMGHVLTQIAQESMYDLFKRRIADPIGMNPDKWGWGNYGVVDNFLLNGGGGYHHDIEISAREMAKFGHLFLNRGNWAGSQVISSDWVDEATQNHVSTSIPLFRDIYTGPDELPSHGDIDHRGFYGYHWIMNGENAAGSRHLPDAPLGTFYRSGYNDNFVVVVPEWDIVIVRLGLDETVTVNEAGSLWNDVLRLISEAFLSPVLTLLSPNGGEVLNAGETFEITWSPEGNIENVIIEYTVNSGTDWVEIIESTENDGSYIWDVPFEFSDECLVRISDVAGAANDVGDEVFSIEDLDSYTVPVNQSSDDAEERDDGVVDLTSTDLELVHDDNDAVDVDQLVGMRFQGVVVPLGTTIQSAYIEFVADLDTSSETSLTLSGQAADNPDTFESAGAEIANFNISSRPRTAASVAWTDVAAWADDQKYPTPDLSPIVQEIVDRGGWSSGNAMVFFVEGSGLRRAESYDGEGLTEPRLFITYSKNTPPALDGDFSPADCDVDGTDLAALAMDLGLLDLATFAGNLGLVKCPPEL